VLAVLVSRTCFMPYFAQPLIEAFPLLRRHGFTSCDNASRLLRAVFANLMPR
jgi:hypothetical protein